MRLRLRYLALGLGCVFGLVAGSVFAATGTDALISIMTVGLIFAGTLFSFFAAWFFNREVLEAGGVRW